MAEGRELLKLLQMLKNLPYEQQIVIVENFEGITHETKKSLLESLERLKMLDIIKAKEKDNG